MSLLRDTAFLLVLMGLLFAVAAEEMPPEPRVAPLESERTAP